MLNPTRRNRNIGTSKQGHGQNNRLVIPYPAHVQKEFFESLGKYEKVTQRINSKKFTFVVEETRQDSNHACSIEDIATVIERIPIDDYGELNLIILRQPKRKEEILSPVWGRLIYSYDFEGDSRPAIILEAVNYSKEFKWSKKLSIDARNELEELKKDGHPIVEDKKYFTSIYEVKNVRNTQLFRTLPHEFGHYVHYLEVVERPSLEDEEFEDWEKRYDSYFALPTSEKERYANKYVSNLDLKRF